MGDGAVGLSSGSFPFLDTTMVDFDDCSTASYYSYTYGDLADDSSYSSYCTSNTSYTAPVEIFEALYYDDGSGAEFDLDGLRILFTPDGDSAYSWETWAPDDGSGKRLFDVPSTSAILLDLMDDDYMSVAINDGFTFYGTTYLQAFVGSNGYVSFTGGDLSYTETVSEHFSQPRIAILYDDLNPSYSEGGGVYYEFLDSDDDGEARLVVTFWDVYEYYYENKYTMQAVMYLGSGNIMLSYGRMNAYNYASSSSDDGIVGLSPGYMPFLDLIEADFSECGAAAWYSYDYDCDATQTTVCSAAAATAPVQLFMEGLGEDSTCANTEGDATDVYGDGCDDGYDEYPYWCGIYDDSDFSSNDMCCGCGGGAEFTDDDPQGWSEYYFDLAEHEITFSPNSAGSAYAYTVKSNSGCLYDMPSATASALDVDFFDYEAYYMSGGFEFYGEEHYIAYVNSNGYITFGSSDADWFVDWTDNYYDHFDRPRVSLFYDTLYTGGTYQEGVILAEDLSDSAGGGDRTSITFWNIEQAGVSTYSYWGDDTRNFGQVTMFWDTGAVVLSYGRVDLNDALVGLSPGYFPFLDLAQSDFSACTSADYFSFSASDFGATGTAVCTQSSDHIYAEVFEDGVDFDLMYKQITFTPSSDGSGYTYATTTVSALADLPSSAAVDLDLGDDDYSQVGLPSAFSFYGEDYASCYVGSNGYITFGGADWNWDPSWASMFGGMPRVAALFTDFAPWEQGGVFYETVGSGTSERLVVTWWQVPHYNCYYLDELYGSEYVNYCDNYVQASLYTATGKVVLSYMDVTYGLGQALVGLSPGYSEGAKTTDYSACTAASYCTNDELCAYAGDAEAAFAFAYTSYNSPFNLENSMVTFMPVSDSTWTYEVNKTNCPQETMSAGLSPLPLYDDSYEVVDLGETGFSFYGVTYDSVFVGSNGFLTFGMGDTSYFASLYYHFDMPRISLFFDDLTPASAGGYGGDIYSEMKGTTGAADERLVVTFDGVSQYGTDDGGCYGQAVLWLASGKIQLIYGNVGTSDGVVGLSSGTQPSGIPTASFLDETMCPSAATLTPSDDDDSTNSLDDVTNCIGYCANMYQLDDDSLFGGGSVSVCSSYKRMLVTCWSIPVECTYEGDAVWNELTNACIATGCTDQQCGIENVDDGATTIVTTYSVQQTVSMSGMSESDFLGNDDADPTYDMSASTITIFKTGVVYASGYSDTITADDVTITAVGSTSVSLRRGLLDADDDAVSVDYEIASDTFTADDVSAVADAVSTSVSSGSFSSTLSTAAVDLGLTTVYTATLASATATVTASVTATTTTTVVVDDYTPGAGQTPSPTALDESGNDNSGGGDDDDDDDDPRGNDNSGGDDGDDEATSGGSEDNDNSGGVADPDEASSSDDMAIIIIVLAIVACLCVGVGVGAGVYLVVFRGKGGNGGGSDAAPPMQYNTGVQMTGNLANVAQAVPLSGVGGAMPVKAEPIAGMGVPQVAIVAGGGNVSTRDVLTRAGIAPDRSTAYLRLLHDFPSYDSLAVLSTSDLERLGLQTADARAIAETCKSMAQSGGGGGASRVSL